MHSTGNDVVALAAIDIARTKQPRFYSKILSASEITLYGSPGVSEIPLEIFVWLLWSVKEAAYKYLQRHNPALVFTPVKFEVQDISMPADKTLQRFKLSQMEGAGFTEKETYKGLVIYAGTTLYFAASIYQELIHTVVNNGPDFNDTYWGIRYIDDTDTQSAAVRSILLHKLNAQLKSDDLSIVKNPHGCPILTEENEEVNLPISLAHHQHWVAYSFQNL
jgi:phosphopantetheinyl transferase (holo-ACP synthase)